MKVAGRNNMVMICKNRIERFSFNAKTARVFESSARDFIAMLSLCIDSATRREDSAIFLFKELSFCAIRLYT